MDDREEDLEYRRIVAREASERIDRILRAMGEGDPWSKVEREAHTLAGIAGELDVELGRAAKDLAGLFYDPFGRPKPLTPEEEARARSSIQRLERGIARIEPADEAGREAGR